MRNVFRWLPGLREWMICALLFATPVAVLAQTTAPGERISINTGWRFQTGDPSDAKASLFYDVRPEVIITEDGKPADAPPDEAAKLAASKLRVLKPWILPSGNAFIKDPAKRYRRPEGDPGSDVSYMQASFDDSRDRKSVV